MLNLMDKEANQDLYDGFSRYSSIISGSPALVVCHVAWSSTELGISLDNFVYRLKKIFLCIATCDRQHKYRQSKFAQNGIHVKIKATQCQRRVFN